MRLELGNEDLKPEHIDCSTSKTTFEKFTEKTQKAIMIVGGATFYNNNRGSYNTIYPPKHPPISPGTKVKTTQPNMALCKEWTTEAWNDRKWQILGTVITHHDSHGLFYDVQHDDGTVGYYDPSELEIVP